MNFYSVLVDSDDEETPQVVSKTNNKTEAKDSKKSNQNSKPASGNNSAAPDSKASDAKSGPKDKAVTKPNGDKEKSNKPKDTRKDPAPAADLAPVKSAELGARDAGGHGSKQHRENRDKKGRGGKNTDKKDGSNRREYDRRSGEDANTKRAPKQGGGAHNWGNENDEARIASKQGKIDGEDLDPTGDSGEFAETEESSSPPPPETFTLDEYLAKRSLNRTNQDLFGSVQARNVESDLAGAKPASNPLEDFMVIGGLKENKSNKAKEAKTKQVIAVDFINASLEKDRDEKSDNRGGGGGGGRRSGGGKSSGGGGRSQAKIDISDKSAFPSL